MQAFVYKSLAKADTYVYLRERDGFGALPAALAQMLGELRFVLAVELTAGRKLAREDAATVRANLGARGWHLQLPPGKALDAVDD
ncbi:YcgL domain-containing protein DSC_00375 [Mizugakiibacter sediminis]|uniref:Membrane protein n=1 Tax=Mizugakiibacter sediminis TaxID=1475481 RepID=A0A0K8QKG5_9GAMM|nr:YcgL domain-containing protein [Mizugakiibacter sediminis]GAP65324.1 YcgL domain-containing protein DSC_00375 [Mizugakiibacter sediminis]